MGDDSWQKDATGEIACELGPYDYNKQRTLAARIRAYGDQCRRAGAEAMREEAANEAFATLAMSRIVPKYVADRIRRLPLPSAAEAAPPAAGWRVPEGWKLVPVEPTARMSLSGAERVIREYNESAWEDAKDMAEGLNQNQIWQAMLEVSPSPPTTERDARGG